MGLFKHKSAILLEYVQGGAAWEREDLVTLVLLKYTPCYHLPFPILPNIMLVLLSATTCPCCQLTSANGGAAAALGMQLPILGGEGHRPGNT